mgnify:CR=1 FL=1
MNDITPAAKLELPETPKLANKVRFVTAASLFDGHDASINIMRRILQSNGVEVIHLGHNRSVDEVVTAALAEDVQGIAISSYQGGHVEYFKYMIDLLRQRGGAHIKVFGGGGGGRRCLGPQLRDGGALGGGDLVLGHAGAALDEQLELVAGVEALSLAGRVAADVVPDPVLVAIGIEDHRPPAELLL